MNKLWNCSRFLLMNIDDVNNIKSIDEIDISNFEQVDFWIISKLNQTKFLGFISVIVVYSLVMSILSIFGKNESEFLSTLIFIPITGQMLHFYLDSQLWKFSEQHNRENILKYL